MNRIQRRYLAVALLTAVLLGLLVIRDFRSEAHDQQWVMRHTADAMQSGDAEELCALASVEERQSLNLNPDNVRNFLKRTIWRPLRWWTHYPTVQSTEKFPAPTRVDKANYIIWLPPHTTLMVVLLDTPNDGWKLELNSLLSQSMSWADDGARREGYVGLARENGITGIGDSFGKYISLDTYANGIAGH